MHTSPLSIFESCSKPAAPGVPLAVLKRQGQPFLFVPPAARLAVQALDLYSPQTGKARRLRECLRLASRLGLMKFWPKIFLPLSPPDPLVGYLKRTARSAEGPVPPFAVLAGNPRTVGQRFVVLVFDAQGQPAAVVKAGSAPDARQLISREAAFLRRAPGGFPGLPKLLSEFHGSRVEALAMPFYEGEAPSDRERQEAARLLAGWVHSGRETRLDSLAPWRALQGAGANLPEVVRNISELVVAPVLFHGDFAPWNIRKTAQGWVALDWERGEVSGVPLWDWLHFNVQTMLLVQRLSPDELLLLLERELTSPALGDYSAKTHITGQERALALAYFTWTCEVLKPAEGLEALRQLFTLAKARWFA